jgi:enamine deaminase RidA (YjgF/YER057c/UK114 family)
MSKQNNESSRLPAGVTNTRHNPFPVASGFESIYSHGVEVPPASRLLFISGQIGVTPTGETLEGFRAQFEQAIANLSVVLTQAKMTHADLVKLTFFVTRAGDLRELGEIRHQLLAAGTAVTTLVVAALARPDLLVEVEGYAASTTPHNPRLP